MRQAVQPEQRVHLAVEEPSDVQTPEAKTQRNEVDVLGDMTGFQHDKAVASISVLEDRPLEERGNKNGQRSVADNAWLNHRLRDPRSVISGTEAAQGVHRRVI